MPACELSLPDKRKYISDVGELLVQRHGKQKHYEPEQVERASRDRGYPIDYVCWAHVIFDTPEAFHAIHAAAGETCDYVAMKAEVLRDLAGAEGFQWPDIDLSWLEWPDIDLAGIFDWFSWG